MMISPERERAVCGSGYFASIFEVLEGSGIKFRLHLCCYGTFASRPSSGICEWADCICILFLSGTTQTRRTDGDTAVREWNTWDDIADSAGDPAWVWIIHAKTRGCNEDWRYLEGVVGRLLG